MFTLLNISKSKVLLAAFLVFIAFKFNAQTQHAEIKVANNPYGIVNNVWIAYLNKTAILLENVDVQSFFNYVVIISDGNMSDMDLFKSYLSPVWNKDFQDLAYRVGVGSIKNEENVRTYLAGLQPSYKKCFDEFLKKKKEITINQNKKGPANPFPIPQNCGSPCTNSGFESGSGFWDYWAGDPETAANPANLTPGFNPPPPGFFGNANPFTLVNAGGFDPTVGGNILPLVPPGGGNNALQIGDLTAWSGMSWGAARTSISFTVSATNANFTYRYAVVLEDPNDNTHDIVNGFTKRPYFRTKLRDQAGNLLSCGDYEVVADASQLDFTTNFIQTSPSSNIWYRPWTAIFVPLQAYIGQCVTLEFTTSDCKPGGHFGYAYVDCSCEPLGIISSSPNICGNNMVTLTAPAGGASYIWSNSAGGSVGIVGDTTNQSALVDSGGTYQVVISSAGGSACNTTLTVNIGTNPSAPISAFTNMTVCAGSPTQFNNTSSPAGLISGYLWDFNNDGIVDDTTANPANVFSTAGSYPVKLTVAWGLCVDDTTINVTVNAGIVPVLTVAGPFCPNDGPVNLTANIPGGIWTGIGITDANLGVFTPSVSTIGNDTVTYTTPGSCSGFASEVIIVNSNPIANAGPDLNICSFGTGTIGSAALIGCTYSWIPNTGFISGSNISNPTLSLSNLGPNLTITSSYTVTVLEAATGCESSDSVNVMVDAVSSVNAGSIQYVCSGSSAVLAGTIAGNATSGIWSGGSGTFSPNSNTLNAVYTPSIQEYAADSVFLTLTTNDPVGPCSFSSSNTIIYFYELPVVDFSVDNPAGCPILCNTFSFLSTIGGQNSILSWVWDFGDNSEVSNILNPSHCYTESDFYDVQLIVTSSNQCSDSLTKSHFVNVYKVPVAEFDPTPNPTTVLNPNITFNNQSSSDVNYWFWDFGDNTTLAPNIASPTHDYASPVSNKYMVTLIVHNAEGCYDTVSHEILIGPEFTFFIPNAFSPNNDKINDTFFGSGVGIEKYELWVFDRWGDIIFSSKELGVAWDGKANNGQFEAQIDVYIWKVNLVDVYDKSHSYIGVVSLIR